jgi:hypothetical protein
VARAFAVYDADATGMITTQQLAGGCWVHLCLQGLGCQLRLAAFISFLCTEPLMVERHIFFYSHACPAC